MARRKKMDAEDQFSSENLRQTKRKRYSKFPSNSNRFSIYIFKVLKQVHPTVSDYYYFN